VFRRLACWIAPIGLALPLLAQTAAPSANPPTPALKVSSRAVLVDVVVTDRKGKPVTGLKQDAFTVTEQGKPQRISFFEENGKTQPTASVEMPKLPPDVFSNFSPFPQPPAVNVFLLDSLNTPMENQSYVHSQALKFLQSAKPGTRAAVFTMGQVLRFIQGFTDDPSLLVAALNSRKNNEVELPTLMKSGYEAEALKRLLRMMNETVDSHGTTAASPGMVGDLRQFSSENDTSIAYDRMLITLANLQRLAAFLEGFPGRKNIIWFAEKVPFGFVNGDNGVDSGNPAIDDEIRKTLAMLATARAAIYPVNPGAWDNLDLLSAQILAEQAGGQAFPSTNRLSDVIDKITSNSSYFYTLSYSPANARMDGSFRKIGVKVSGGKYSLAYRRGYFAVDAGLPGSAMRVRGEKVHKLADQNPGAVDPLLPFMDLGMPQSEQILYKVRIVPGAAGQTEPAEQKDKNQYTVDFAIDLKDLKLDFDVDGNHKGKLNLSLIVYDRYENVISREDQVIGLDIKPDAYTVFQSTGVQIHAVLAVPKGNYWLRTGVFDQGSRKVGTMEVALSSVVPLLASAK